MDPQEITPLRSSDSNMVLDTKEESLANVNGHKAASDSKKGNAKMRFWSNTILVETFFETNYLKKPSSYEEHLIMRMYLRWYMGFEMGSINPAELVCQMALLTPSKVTDASIFEGLFGMTNYDGITYPSKSRRTLIPVRNVRLPELTPNMLNSYYINKSSECNTKEQLTELGENEKSEICSFYSYAKSTLNITEKNNFKRIILKCYLGLSALVTLRLISKQALTVQKTLRLGFGRMFNGLFGLAQYHPMCAPHLKSLDDVKRGLDLRLPNVKITLHAIILQYVIYCRRSTETKNNARCMLYSLLSFIQLHGLPLVRLYLSLSQFLDDQILVDIEKSASSELLSNLFKHYYGEVSVHENFNICERKISHQDSWKWCRLLDESYFTEFKIESNAQLAYTMAELVTTLGPREANMWNMVGFKNNLDIDMKKEAEIVCKSIKLTQALHHAKMMKCFFSRQL